jgi:hypothetical protein
MRTLQTLWFRYIIIAICSVVVATGCIIERGNLTAGYTTVAPGQYCPGDAMTASYDLLGSDVCPADASCASFFPTVAISSTPAAFPAQSIVGYTGNVNFTAPDADRFSIMFNPDRDDVLIPTAEVVPGSGRVFIRRASLDQTRTASRISAINQELVHDGMCAGAAPVNSSQTLPGLPRFSPNLRLTDLCNVNAVEVIVTLSGGADGTSFTQTLASGQCLSTMPGVPTSTQNARVVEVRPATVAPGTRCDSTGTMNNNVPPPPLRTLARMACR